MIPASVITTDPNIQHIQSVIYYERKAIENLKANLVSYMVMEKRPMPMRNGKTMQFYVNTVGTANVVPVSEGVPGAPRSHYGSTKNTVSLAQYADYMTFSDWIEETAISDIKTEQAEELGYGAARSVDSLNYTQFDTTAAAITAARIDLASSATTAEYMSASVARRAKASLEAANVLPREGNFFSGIMHPLVSFDYANDNTAGGVLDLLKFTSQLGVLKSGVFQSQEDVFVLDGIKWRRSTEVPTTSSYNSGSNLGYHSYVVGKNAFFCTSLSFTQVPQERNFRPRIQQHKGELVDPAGLISASASYNFKYATYVPPDSIARFRRIRCEASIS